MGSNPSKRRVVLKSDPTGEIPKKIFQKGEDIDWVTISLQSFDKVRVFYETEVVEHTIIDLVK